MFGKCEHYDCNLRNNAGHCPSTVCLNPKYQNITCVNPMTMVPSRFCSVCGEYEYKDSAVGKTEFWLCKDCLAKLKKLLEEVNE